VGYITNRVTLPAYDYLKENLVVDRPESFEVALQRLARGPEYLVEYTPGMPPPVYNPEAQKTAAQSALHQFREKVASRISLPKRPDSS
jgi:hypothetical protein